jgi:DegV family protein with EDD domain
MGFSRARARARPASAKIARGQVIRILTNPGANLPDALFERHHIAVTSSSIMVDGKGHDTRSGVTLDAVDQWIAGAREYPYVLGTSAAELARCYVELGAYDRGELLVIMSSRKIIQSYDAACSASRTLASQSSDAPLRIRVVDCGSTDLGLGLAVVLAAEAIEAGMGLDDAADLVEAMAACGRFAFVPRSLDNLVKGGKASFLRGWIANLMRVRPLLAFVDGEVQVVGRCGAGDDHPRVVAEWLAAQIDDGPVWIGIAHGDAPADAERLEAALRDLLDVRYCLTRAITPAVYLHAGRRTIGAVVYPLARLPWMPR